MEYIKVKTNELIPYINNARTHDEAQIKKIQSSIREFGFINPVIIDDKNNIIAGHGRVQAALKEGITEVPCIKESHLSEYQKKAYILADNKLAELSGWDFDLLANEIEELKNTDIDIDMLGFDEKELLKLIEEKHDAEEDGFNLEENLNAKEIVKRGDIWNIGKHRLMCGDSTNEEDVYKLVGEQKVDLLLTDPPYNVSYEGKTKDSLKIENDSMPNEEFREFLKKAFIAADNVMKNGAVFYIWHADLEGYNFRGACADAGWKVRECLIWNKSSMVLGRQDYHWKHEPCLYGWKGGSGHLWNSDRKQTTVLNFEKPSRNGEHPTMKPVALFSYQLQNNTKEEDAVLDLFGGSGTTLIACEQTNRKCFMMELDEKYATVIIKRYIELTKNEGEVYVMRGDKKINYTELAKDV